MRFFRPEMGLSGIFYNFATLNACKTMKTDFLVIGSGAAGLSFALKGVDRLSLDMRSEIPQSEGFSRPLPCKTLVCVLFKSN